MKATFTREEVRDMMISLTSKTIYDYNDYAMPYQKCDEEAVKEVDIFLEDK